ncbi:MAG: 2-oxoglutarate dehydrogenase complex dihydrolipoyllysine-residue succinyltransferase [Myxococcota bacterium]
MSIELKVPPVGESITEVQIGEWLKAEGDIVQRDEVVVKIETDKVTVDLPAPVSGRLGAIKVKQGQPAAVGDVIGLIEEAAAASPSTTVGDPRVPAPAEAPAPSRPPAAHNETPSTPSESQRSRDVRDTIPPQGFARVMPSARRALKERGLRAEDVEATGPGGRVLKEDVMRAPEAAPAPAPAPAPAAETRAPVKAPAAGKPAAPSSGERHEDVVPMSPFRRRIAERLVESQQTAALLTTFNEVDMSAVIALRKEYQEAFQQKYNMKLGFMSFFVKAAIDALKLIPAVNGEIRGNDIVYKNYYDIGVAVGGGKGLAVPVIRSADRLSFAEVEQTINDFGKRAKENKLELHELQGGTFTISNGGVYGSLMSTPIVNPPQSGILGLHAMQDRPVAVDGQVVVRPMMYIALTYDHRLIDGREAVTFLKRIKQCVEQPARMLLEV